MIFWFEDGIVYIGIDGDSVVGDDFDVWVVFVDVLSVEVDFWSGGYCVFVIWYVVVWDVFDVVGVDFDDWVVVVFDFLFLFLMIYDFCDY